MPVAAVQFLGRLAMVYDHYLLIDAFNLEKSELWSSSIGTSPIKVHDKLPGSAGTGTAHRLWRTGGIGPIGNSFRLFRRLVYVYIIDR